MKKEKVAEIAELARLIISDEEAESLANEFSEVLEMFEKIDEIDCEGEKILPINPEPELRDDIESDKRRESKQIKGPRTVE